MSGYEVREAIAESFLFAAARDRVEPGQVPKRIIPLMDIVYAFLKASGIPHLGINVALYDGSDPASLVMDAGVRVPAAFAGDGRVSCLRTPAGPALMVTHRGPYDRMQLAYDALRTWARTNGRELSAQSGEVYGHWTEKPVDLQTDIWWLLR